MNTQITKVSGVVYPPVFDNIIEDVTGGVLIDTTDIPTGVEFLKAGVLLAEDSSTAGKYHICKTAKVHEAVLAEGTSVKIEKNHLFKKDDFISNGTVSTKITAITVGTDYDTLTLTATLDATAAVPVNTILFQGAAEVSTGAVAKYTPDCILGNQVDVIKGNPSGSAIVRGTVRENLLPYFVLTSQKTALSLIRFVS